MSATSSKAKLTARVLAGVVTAALFSMALAGCVDQSSNPPTHLHSAPAPQLAVVAPMNAGV